MARITVLTFLFLVGFTVSLINGELLSPENHVLPNISELEFLSKDLNLTDFSESDIDVHPHSYLNVEEIIKLYDYKVETHTVQTDDEYILTVHRLPGKKGDLNLNSKPVVFLQHGILSSSIDWVLAGPSKGLAFILADAGYDVWMGNVRGNRYSRKHKRLTVDDPLYWTFSWHEIGKHDIPAMIDHALEVSGRKKLFYIGHSQGSTTFFVMTSELPEYNDKINAMFSLAPVAYCSGIFSPIFRVLAKISPSINLVAKLIGKYEFKPSGDFLKKFSLTYCKEHDITQALCMNALFMFTGFNEDQLDKNLLPAILSHIPAGAGINQLIHYAQSVKSGHFRQYDYGMRGNINKYNSFVPPSYNLKNVKAPISLHYSVNDWLSDALDVEKLHSKLPNTIGKFRVPHDKFSHLDYLWGKDVKTLLYNKIMTIMQRYKD